jgi:diaminopimelate decarboxylase
MSSNYNGKPQPAEVLLRDGKAHLVRARQTLADLVRGETIPRE